MRVFQELFIDLTNSLFLLVVGTLNPPKTLLTDYNAEVDLKATSLPRASPTRSPHEALQSPSQTVSPSNCMKLRPSNRTHEASKSVRIFRTSYTACAVGRNWTSGGVVRSASMRTIWSSETDRSTFMGKIYTRSQRVLANIGAFLNASAQA